MREYRLYCRDGVGRVTSAEWISAESDAEAMDAARSWKPGVQCEVWERDRLVGMVEPGK